MKLSDKKECSKEKIEGIHSAEFYGFDQLEREHRVDYPFVGGKHPDGRKRHHHGYDHLIFEGKADKPVYLWINDAEVEIIGKAGVELELPEGALVRDLLEESYDDKGLRY